MTRPVGIFDSGLGGLTVLKAVRETLPNEPICYFGDTARVPYGTKSASTIVKFSRENTRFLLSKDVKFIIVGCHTASSLALDSLVQEFDVPIIGVVHPGALKAVEVTRSGKIGIIGTKSTIASGAYQNAIQKLDSSCRVEGAACPLLVPMIEEGWSDNDVVNRVLDHYLKPFLSGEFDTIVLGCTHYPIFQKQISDRLPDHVQIVNPADETALLLKEQLSEKSDQASEDIRYYVSDEPEQFALNGERFLGVSLGAVELVDSSLFEGV